MRQFLDRTSMSFAAGAFGAVASSVAFWAAGADHLVRDHWCLRGIVLSLAPTAFQMLYVFPRHAGQGYFGLASAR
jgi:hypothetical protein